MSRITALIFRIVIPMLARAASLLTLCVLCAAAGAQSIVAPPAQELKARLDSRFIQRLLAEPFTDDHHRTGVAVKTLHHSGNVEEAYLLDQAKQRRLLSSAVGPPSAYPATMNAAIAGEFTGKALGHELRVALGRVQVSSASESDAQAADRSTRETRRADGVWTTESIGETRVKALYRIRNGLAVPLRSVGLSIQSLAGSQKLRLACEPQNPREIPRGGTRVVLCSGSHRTEDIADPLGLLLEQRTGEPFEAGWVRFNAAPGEMLITSEAGGRGAGVYVENGNDGDGESEAFAALAGATCEERAACLPIAQAPEQARQQRASGMQSAPQQPAADQMLATRDSPFVHELLGRPFPTTPDGLEEAIRLLHFSGNIEEADVLRRVQGRAALHRLVGDAPPHPTGTIGKVISAERQGSQPLVTATQAVIDRIVAGYPPGGANASVVADANTPTHGRISATLRITNGLEVPVTNITFLAGLPAGPTHSARMIGLRCRPQPPIAPHAVVDAVCEGGSTMDDIALGVEALRTRARLPVHSVDTPGLQILNAQPIVSSRENPALDQALMGRLASLSCQQKGTCQQMARAQQRKWNEERGPVTVGWLTAAAAVASALVATRRRRGDREAVPGAILSVALVAFSLFIAGTAAMLLKNDLLAVLGMVGLYYGALPFLVALATVGGTLASGRTTALRLFAVTFALLSSALAGWAVLIA
jgi:hypothetical protein